MSALHCPACASPRVAVIDTRAPKPGSIRRRRKCGACGYRYTTIEITEEVFKNLMSSDKLAEQRRALRRIADEITDLAKD